MTYPPQKILILKLAAIGDVIMALPLAKKFKELYPECEITWIAGKIVTPLLKEIVEIDKIIVVNETRLLKGSKPQQMAEVLKLWNVLRAHEYDLVLNGHVDTRYHLLSRPVKALQRGWHREPGQRPWPIPGRHHSDEYVRLAYDRDDFSNPRAQPITLRLPAPEFFQPLSQPTVALAPGGAKNALADDFLRRWPLSSYVELARTLLAQGCTVVLTGAPSDAWVRNAFQDMGPQLLDYIGRTDLLSLVGLYSAVDVVVTHDSGPLHLAGLSGTPLVALFGPTIPAEKVPRGRAVKVFWGGEDLACRPCYDGKTYADCPFPACMAATSVEAVKAQVLNFIAMKETTL